MNENIHTESQNVLKKFEFVDIYTNTIVEYLLRDVSKDETVGFEFLISANRTPRIKEV